MLDEAINDFLTAVDEPLRTDPSGFTSPDVLRLPPAERLRWHLGAARGSLDWFTQGQRALERLGQPQSEAYARAIKSAEAFIRSGEALLEGNPS